MMIVAVAASTEKHAEKTPPRATAALRARYVPASAFRNVLARAVAPKTLALSSVRSQPSHLKFVPGKKKQDYSRG